MEAGLAEQLRDERRVYEVRLRQRGGKTSAKLHAHVGGMAVTLFASSSRKQKMTGSARASSTSKPVRTFVLERCRLQLLEAGLVIFDGSDEVTLIGAEMEEMTLAITDRMHRLEAGRQPCEPEAEPELEPETEPETEPEPEPEPEPELDPEPEPEPEPQPEPEPEPIPIPEAVPPDSEIIRPLARPVRVALSGLPAQASAADTAEPDLRDMEEITWAGEELHSKAVLGAILRPPAERVRLHAQPSAGAAVRLDFARQQTVPQQPVVATEAAQSDGDAPAPAVCSICNQVFPRRSYCIYELVRGERRRCTSCVESCGASSSGSGSDVEEKDDDHEPGMQWRARRFGAAGQPPTGNAPRRMADPDDDI